MPPITAATILYVIAAALFLLGLIPAAPSALLHVGLALFALAHVVP